MIIAKDFFSVVDVIAETNDVISTILDGRCKTMIECVDLVTKIGRIFTSAVSVVIDFVASINSGRDFSRILEDCAVIARRCSFVANFLQSGSRFVVQLENRTATFPTCLQLAGSGVVVFAEDIARALTNNSSSAWWISNAAELVVQTTKYFPHIVDGMRRIGRIWTPNESPTRTLSDPSSSSSDLLETNSVQAPEIGQDPLDSPWWRLQRLIERNNVRPSTIDRFIENSFIRQGLRRFICPISHSIIISPLKHVESGLLFEKTVIAPILERNLHYSFESHDITRDALLASPEDQILIAEKINMIMQMACVFYSRIQERAARQPEMENPTPHAVVSREESAAFERLDRQWRVVSFVAIKKSVWIKLKGEFDAINVMMTSHRYWDIDPRKYRVEQVKSEITDAEVQREAELMQPINPQELIEQLNRLKNDSFIPGIFGCWLWRYLFDPEISERISMIPQLIDTMTGGVDQ